MCLNNKYLAILSAVLALTLIQPGSASAQSPAATSDLRQTVLEFDQWLGTGANGKNWRDYLRLQPLSDALGKGGGQVDRDVLLASYERFSGGNPALALPRYAKVRHALEQRIAKLPALAPADLARQVAAAEADYKPVTPQQAQAAHDRLTADLGRLNKYLDQKPDHGEHWRQVLELDDATGELAKKAPDPGILRRVAHRFFSNQKGFEKPVYSFVGKDLLNYAEVVAATANPDQAKQATEAQLKTLGGALEKMTGASALDGYREIEADAYLLHVGRQAPGLLREVRARFNRPNLRGQASDALVRVAFEDKRAPTAPSHRNLPPGVRLVDDTIPVEDVIMGTYISGTAHTIGTVTMRLLPNPNYASFETRMDGTTYSSTVGSHPPATIFTSGVTQLHGVKRGSIDEMGVDGEPACSQACTSTTIDGICISSKHFQRLISRVANKRVYESKGQAEQVAGQHAAERLDRRLDEQYGTSMAQGNQNYNDKLRDRLVRLNIYPQLLHYASTEKAVLAESIEAAPGQFSAPDDPTPIQGVAPDVLVHLHESLINNLAQSLLGGSRLRYPEIRQKMKEMKVEPPKDNDEPVDEEGDVDRTITFATYQPVTVRFDDQKFTVVVRTSATTDGNGKSHDIPFKISAAYTVVDGLKANRDGDVKVEPVGKEYEGLQVAKTGVPRRQLERAFAKILKPTLALEPLKPQGALGDKTGPLPPKEMASSHGWLTVGWQLDAAEVGKRR